MSSELFPKLVTPILAGLGILALVLVHSLSDPPSRASHILILFTFGGASALAWRNYRNGPTARLSKREILPLSEFVRHYGQNLAMPDGIVELALQEIGEACWVNPGRLRPTDRFDTELVSTGFLNISDEPMFVMSALEQLLEKMGAPQNLEENDIPMTVGEFLEKVSKAYASAPKQQH